MEKNSLDDLFRRKFNSVSYEATEDDWNAVAGHFNLSKPKTHFLGRNWGWLIPVLGIVIVFNIQFFSNREIGYFQLFEGENVKPPSFKMNPETMDRKNAFIDNKITQSQNDKANYQSSNSEKKESSSVIKPKKRKAINRNIEGIDIYLSTGDLHDEKLVVKGDEHKEEKPRLNDGKNFLSVGTIDKLMSTPLQSTTDIRQPPFLDLLQPMRKWLNLELLIGSAGLENHISSSLLISIFSYRRISADVGLGLHFRQFDNELIAREAFTTYSFGREDQMVSLFTDRWLQLQFPIRFVYHLDRKNRLELTGSIMRHLNGFGSIESTWSEIPNNRIGITDDYFDLWTMSGQLHYTYDLSILRIGAGVRVDRIIFNPRINVGDRMNRLPVSLEFKIVKPL